MIEDLSKTRCVSKICVLVVVLTVMVGLSVWFVYVLMSDHPVDQWVNRYLLIPSSDSASDHMKILSQTAHIAGSIQNYNTAVYIKEKWEEYGIPDVSMEKYNVLLSYPIRVSASVEIEGGIYHAQLKEDVIVEDPTSGDINALGAFHGYSGSGNVSASLIYANYGREIDFEYLESIGLNVSGKIVICRYGKIYRGNKVREAEIRGAVGVIIYSDPIDDGGSKGKVYPEGPYRPPSSFQRGAVNMGDGDPLTPGLPAWENASRLSIEDLYNPEIMGHDTLPKIPSIPMGYGDAEYFLKAMVGVKVPSEWQGGLHFEYSFEGGYVNLDVDMNYTIREIWNVIGEIPGNIEKDRQIIFGSHRDAWTLGAGDPISGTTTIMEISRGFGEMYKSGWKPRRTIKMCSWDAEEYALIGSYEFVESHFYELQHRAIIYFNVDIAVDGTDRFSFLASASMGSIMRNITKAVPHPADPKLTVFDMWKKTEEAEKGELEFLGSGSDFTAFLQEVGVISTDFRFSSYEDVVAKYQSVYHSNYDSFTWMSTFGDPGFVYHTTMAKVMGLTIMSFADSRMLPLDFVEYSHILKSTFQEFKRHIDEKVPNSEGNDISLERINRAVNIFETNAIELQKVVWDLNSKSIFEEKNELEMRKVNDILTFAERTFINYGGITDRKFIRHMAYAPSVNNAYGSTLFPTLSDLIFEITPDPKLIEFEIGIIAVYIERAANFLKIS